MTVASAKAEVSADDDFDATQHPYEWLLWHCAKKSVQTGAVIGTAAWPVAAIIGKVGPQGPLPLIGKVALYATGGVFLAACGRVAAVSGDRDGIVDRAYRLHYNKLQNHVDKFSAAGGLASAAALAAFKGTRAPLALAGGFAIGAAMGVAMHLPVSRMQQKEE